MTVLYRFHVCIGFYLTVVAVASAQAPKVGYLFPPAIQRGQNIDVAIGGYDFTPDMQVFTFDQGVQLQQTGPPGKFHLTPPPYWTGPRQYANAQLVPREMPGKLTVPSTQPLGLCRWQVANANGGSPNGVFLVTGIRETLENRIGKEPQETGEMPVGISGRLSRISEKDAYQLTARHDGPVTVDVWARRLGSNLNAAIQVVDSQGHMCVDETDTEGQDLTVTFAARKEETYTVYLHDTDFRGMRQFVYRIAFWDEPRVLSMRPARLVPGQKQSVELTGYGLRTGRAELESFQTEITLETKQSHSVRRRLETPTGRCVPVDIFLQTDPVEERTESGAGPHTIDHGQAITNRLPDDQTIHEYRFLASAESDYHLRVESFAIRGGLDVAVAILGPDGKQLAENDDGPNSTDAVLSVKAMESGEHLIRVTGISQQSESQRLYRLQLTGSPFALRLSADQTLAGKPGAKIDFPVNLADPQDQPIALTVEGLPEGVTVEGEPIIEAGQKEAKITLAVSEQVRVQATPVRIFGRTVDPEQKESTSTELHPAVATAGGNLCDPISATTGQILLVLTMDAPFSLELVDKNRQRVVHRGTTYPAPFKIKRDDGFEGELRIVMQAAQSRHRMGIRGTTVVVAPDQNEALYPCFMPEWISTARTSRMVVMAVGQVADPQGHLRHLTKPADARVTMICEGALLKVSHEAKELSVARGNSFQLPVNVLRNSKLQTTVKIDLEVPPELDGLLQYTPVMLKSNEHQAVLNVQTSDHEHLRGTVPVTVRASTLQDGRWPVYSYTDVEVDFIP